MHLVIYLKWNEKHHGFNFLRNVTQNHPPLPLSGFVCEKDRFKNLE